MSCRSRSFSTTLAMFLRLLCVSAALVFAGCIDAPRAEIKEYQAGYEAGVNAGNQAAQDLSAAISPTTLRDIADPARYHEQTGKSAAFQEGFEAGLRDAAKRVNSAP